MAKYFLIILLFLPKLCFADNSIVNVDGLSFRCDSCKKTDSNFCEVPWQGKTLTVLCDSLFEVLLQKAHQEKTIDYPKNEELLSLIARSDYDSSIVELVFEILISRNLNTNTFDSLIEILLSKHYQVFSSALVKDKFNIQSLQALWPKRTQLKAREIFLLSKKIPDKGIDEFFKELSVVDIKNDLKIVKVLLASDVLNEDERNIFNSLNTFILDCSNKFKCDYKVDNLELMKYSKRLQNSVISKAVIDGKISNPISLLSQLEYVDYRTPETHQALLLTLSNQITERSFNQIWQSLSLKEKDFITFMASNDSRIAQIVYKEQGSDYIVWLIGIVFSAIAAIFYFYYNKNRIEAINENFSLRKDLKELNAIWSFFDLPVNASVKDLKKRYREMAREMHPDAGMEDSEKFLLLNDYYKKALDLLTK